MLRSQLGLNFLTFIVTCVLFPLYMYLPLCHQFCQFQGDDGYHENEPVFCPDDRLCEPGSLCYLDSKGEYYCDCHHGGPNAQYADHNCHREQKLNCSEVLGLSDPNHVCFNGATCTGNGGCNCVEGFTGPVRFAQTSEMW